MSPSIWVALLGSEIRFVQGKKYRTRIAEAGREHPETFIMLHGGGGHLETYAHNIVPLGQHVHVIGVEMLWHGLSDAPPIGEDRNAQVAEQVLDVMDALGIEKTWIHGEAAGSGAAMWLVMKHAGRIKGAVFEGGAGVRFKEGTVTPARPPVGGIPMGERTLQLLKNPTWQGVKERLLMVMHYNHPERVTDELVDVRLAHYSRPFTNDAQTRYYSASASGGRGGAFTEEDAAQIRMPVLAIWPDGSGGAGPDAGQRLASLIPGGQFKLLTEAGYWGHWEKADQFNEAIRQFIMGEKVT